VRIGRSEFERDNLHDVAAFFDQRAATYERHDMHRWLAAQVVSVVKTRPGMKVLDVATGTGLVARALLASTPSISVVGVDISPGMLAVAQEKMTEATRFSVSLADASALPFQDETFDGVFCVASIAYLSDADAALAEWVRVCRTSGKVAITTFMNDGITSQRLIRAAAEREGLLIDDPNKSWGTDAKLKAFAKRGGLSNISVSHVTHEEPMRDPASGWQNFFRSPSATELRNSDDGLIARVHDRYIEEYNVMKMRGEHNCRTSIILSGSPLPKHRTKLN